ncbi:hypothetical protein CLAIMM_12310 [Cladophialophora immunda]|nr:hypothetical protein CLAIMM_12310 [Cladophialophora immunda]
MMDMEDIDATPRVLRVINSGLKENEEDAESSPQLCAEKTTRFSLRSVSASLSSIWGRRNASTSTSCSHSESSQGQSWSVAPDLDLDLDDNLPSRGCVSFSTLLTSHKSSARAVRKKRLNFDRDVKPSCSQSRSSVSRLSSNHFSHPQTAQGRFPIDVEDEQSSVYSFASFSTDHSSRHSTKIHHDLAKRQPTTVGERVSTTMASGLPNGVYTDSVPNHQDLRIPAHINNRVTAPAVQAPTLQNTLDFRGSLTNEAFATTSFLTPVHQNEPLVNGNTVPSALLVNGETIPSAPPPSLASTMYPDEIIAPPVGRDPIQHRFDAYHSRDNFSDLTRSYHPNPLQHPPPRNTPIVPLPAIAALKVETFAFHVLEAGAKSPMTTYVTFDLTAVKQNKVETQAHALQSQDRSYILMENDEGSLVDLSIQTYVKGPASKLFEVGFQSIQKLRVEDRWTLLLKLGAKENTLKSKLSSSLRSGTRTSSSLSLIDQFLASLKMDSKRSEPVSVEAIIKYRHAFLPDDTTLETRAVCRVDSLASASSMDAVEAGVLAGSIIHALDPGVNTVKLLSVDRQERQHHLELGGGQALALIYDFRHALGHVISESVTWDLAVLETYYRQVLALESSPAPTRRDTICRRVTTVAKRFSPRKSGGAGPGGEGRVG